MNDKDLPIVLGALKKKHPHLVDSIRTLSKQTDPTVASAATTLLQGLLTIFDVGEQAQWQLRDLLKAQPKVGGDHYWAMKYDATEMVYRIASAGGLDVTKTSWWSNRYTPTMTNWKNAEGENRG